MKIRELFFPPKQPKPTYMHKWDPQPDIATYELARCLRVLCVHMTIDECNLRIEAMPEECKRHFTRIELP
jgi:hypothetical protein